MEFNQLFMGTIWNFMDYLNDFQEFVWTFIIYYGLFKSFMDSIYDSLENLWILPICYGDFNESL